ncbi:MAG TPA: quinone-interacting membrane-bound oxidoreductase complex subunit QmoC [Terracidiphilus sp.]|nr:quinone-interacting membrane-bound oxidoreductase complex subunit QmoC [Terracidiphilus sp.]
MADTVTIQPDHEFIREVMESSGGDMKKCFQCATCTSVCSLATEERPFPRKQMLEAQWGLVDRLAGDPAIWLCHNCGDCTTRCPRGGRPSDVMAAVRTAVIRRLAFPRFLGTLVAMRENGALMFVLSALVLVSLAVLPIPGPAARPFIFAEMFPKSRLEPLFFIVSGYVLLALVISAWRFARLLRAYGADGPILPSLAPALVEILTHRRFASCSKANPRRLGHLLVLSAFVGLAAMGTVVGIGSMIGWIDTPIPIQHPLKIFANLCALALVAGVGLLFWNRLTDRDKRAGSAFCDWFFLIMLGGAGATGLLSEALRLAQIREWMFVVYFVHLTMVMTLILCVPYSKFAHFLYRTMAIAATWRETRSPGRQTESARKVPIAPA